MCVCVWGGGGGRGGGGLGLGGGVVGWGWAGGGGGAVGRAILLPYTTLCRGVRREGSREGDLWPRWCVYAWVRAGVCSQA